MRKIYLLLVLSVISILNCVDRFSYTGYQDKYSSDYEYSGSVDIAIKKNVRFEALVTHESGILNIKVLSPSGENKKEASITSIGNTLIQEDFKFEPGRWTFSLKSNEGTGNIKVKIHNRNNYENF